MVQNLSAVVFNALAIFCNLMVFCFKNQLPNESTNCLCSPLFGRISFVSWSITCSLYTLNRFFREFKKIPSCKRGHPCIICTGVFYIALAGADLMQLGIFIIAFHLHQTLVACCP